MKIADRRGVPEANNRPGKLSFKDAETASGQLLALDDAEGIVTAIVSVTGTEDEVADIIEPGAYRETLIKRRPKVCWAHSWEHPIGRVLYIEELAPGDDRLPTKTKDGKPWPREAGALVATMQFNMRTDEGKNAFEAVRFYSETGECEYSIGYQVPAGKSTRDNKGVRHIKALDLYELSVVLFGAHTMTGTLSIKAAITAAVNRARGRTAAQVLAAETKTLAEAGKEAEKVPDFTDGVMVAVYPDPEAADKVAQAISGTDDTLEREDLHVTLAYLGKVGDLTMSSDEVVKKVTDVLEGERGLTGTIGGIGTFPPGNDGAPTWVPVDVPGLSLLRETIVQALGDVVNTEHGFAPHMTIGYDIGLIDPIPEIPVKITEVRVVYGEQARTISLGPTGDEDWMSGKSMTAAEREKKPTMPGTDGKFPIGNVDDLRNAIRLYGNSSEDKEKVKAWIIRRARALNAVNVLPDDWNVTKAMPIIDLDRDLTVDEAARLTAYLELDAEVKAGGTDRNRGQAEELRHYWTTGEGGAKIAWNTPGDFTRCTRFLSEHMTPERAKGYCANRHKEMTGMWPGDKDNKADAYDPALDGGTIDVESKDSAVPAASGKSYPRLPGSYEERQDALNAAVVENLRGDESEDGKYEWDYVCVDATFDDHVIATRTNWDGPDQRESFEMTYTFTADGIELGTPVPCELQVVAIPTDLSDGEDYPVGDSLPLASDVDKIAYGFKAAHAASMETKAGRVLSGANERQLRSAVENLVNVLAAAGVKITVAEPADEPDEPDAANAAKRGDVREPIDPNVDLSTTSPSASTKTLEDGRIVVEADDVAKTLASLGIDT